VLLSVCEKPIFFGVCLGRRRWLAHICAPDHMVVYSGTLFATQYVRLCGLQRCLITIW
jgi:hypothetical protein